jgi:predicted AAA+ superfamily ATPase
MIHRELSSSILRLSQKMPVIVITGPRQSGKTTLVKSLFPKYVYYNLEFPDIRMLAENDPRGFLQNFQNGIIIDEIQHVPILLSYIQGLADESGLLGKFIITGSQNLNLLESVSQSLAGRAAVFTLLPLSISELSDGPYFHSDNHLHHIYNGWYPAVYDRELLPNEWLQSYIQTYVERDVRQIVNVKDLSKFQLFVRLCAGRIGQLINFNQLSGEVGVDGKTIKKWLSVLETGYIIFLLYPYHKNYNKRLVKTPKLYFYDVGLACQLLDLKSEEQVFHHFARGPLFENMIIADIKKTFFHAGENRSIYFWRDNVGNEIDCMFESGDDLHVYEIKSSQTFHPKFISGLDYFKKISAIKQLQRSVVYAGNKTHTYNDVNIYSWSDSYGLHKDVNEK